LERSRSTTRTVCVFSQSERDHRSDEAMSRFDVATGGLPHAQQCDLSLHELPPAGLVRKPLHCLSTRRRFSKPTMCENVRHVRERSE
jgi:hypothetical protein